MTRRIIPIYLDTEVVRGREVGELGLLNASSGKTFTVRMRTEEGQKALATFMEGWRQAVDWIQQQIGAEDTVVLIGHNVDRHDMKKLREQFLANIRTTHETELQRLWPEFKTFDTLSLSKIVHPVKKVDNLAALRHKYRVPYDEEGAHRALGDCYTNKAALEKMAGSLPMDELYPLMALSDGVAKVAERILAARPIIPVFIHSTLSIPMKKDKFEEGPMPRLVRIEALSPLKPDEPFSSLVRLPKDAPWDPTVAEGLTNCNLEGQEVPLFQDVFKALKQWVRERLPGTNHRVALIAWDAWYRDQLVFKTECERRGKTVPHHWTWFSLNYVKNCVVRGFWNEDESSVEKLLKHYRITPTGCSVRDLGLLYDCLLGYADQRKVLEAMFEFPSVIPVAQVALEAQQAEPVFFDLETTGLIEYRRRADKPRFYEKDEKGNKIVEKWPGITQIAAFFPSRLERIEALPLEELAAGATLYQFAGLGKEHLPLHPGTVSLRIGEKVYPESALKIDYESGKFQLNFPEPAAAAQVTLSFTHEAKAWFQHYVRPEVPIDPEAEKITGITLDPSRQTGRVVCVSDCPTFKEVGRLFFEKVFEGCTQGKRPVLIAHNCWHFDKPILENMCQKAGLVVKDLSWFDTLYLAAKVFGGGIKGNGINDLCTHYGIRQREGHKADSDVAAMYGIVQHLFEGCDPTKLYNLMLKKQALEKVYREIVRYRPLPEFSCEELEFDL